MPAPTPLPKPSNKKPPNVTLGGQAISPSPEQIPHEPKTVKEQQQALTNLQKIFKEINQRTDGDQED